ncbi:kinesin, putative [Coccidioides posadasii C735 delta SOWgp]|uniref:Kinesin, putative n=1 Tax=Coccidioides posadasii (strain C735) TaxID=222929 RepID=C5P6D2_COCP7|nr:kinesin, putative [Coccidioides posadasii C735 delta SOWgp]EER26982.1 kinesin, putative [Coccidioides posadasii C735 delta SOWgp]|eukprot:XP_003069127.1 kinesin, putative [Coccidioides posadasii C735 delta SOWgp]
MTNSPPGSPPRSGIQRPLSAIMRPPRSHSRLSVGSKQGGGSRASDEDGKTAVKVAVRVRPPLKPTDPGYELIPPRFQRATVHVTSDTSLAVDSPQGRKLFVFDRVFNETIDQDGIWQYLQDSVNSFVQGYNVSILAYGQSGAGKSYTMGTSGPAEQNDPQAMGIVPRAAQMLFEKLTDSNANHSRTGSTGLRTPARYSIASSLPNFGKGNLDKNWQLKATYVEIYNEHLRDLLVPESTPMSDRNTVTIREDTKGRIILTGLNQVNINSFEDLLGALNFGSAIRQTDATAVNAKSSRSHAVFSLNLVQRKDPTSTMSAKEKRFSVPVEAFSGADTSFVTVDSKLHFVDLAGSERLKNTGASGERAKEGISINAGLASLGKVISQLSSRHAGAHVSYRDSKLTRLLQDSLGGNAITYMIACVTPAEFHLSETLNTVQYAQRARAIQSKPRIQQVTDERDKQAVIERLKAEVAFLRQQIRNTEGGERRSGPLQDRSERQSEREIELQNHLLDIQESYTALSQRHAKLISELTKASDFNGDDDDLQNIISGSAMERLKRSHSFAESVEQVVLEYEKTIQSLESSLSNTRSSLSNTESTLLERETKCAYVETVNSQLQARIQKMMDREANTESYLHDLESKLDGHASGEEKNASIIAELRKEIARARENEASCEDYISTLEERLAEADQDMELMQREMERLEHVIDRQRSLGKLDTLLYELDHIQQNGSRGEKEKDVIVGPPPATVQKRKTSRARSLQLDVLMEAAETAIPESDDDLVDQPLSDENLPSVDAPNDDSGLEALERASAPQNADNLTAHDEYPPQSPAQSRFVADKLESVTHELFELRIQHENTVNEYDLLHAKYDEALRTLAELRDAVDEARHPAEPTTLSPMGKTHPVSFLEDVGAQQLKNGNQCSLSRSLSSEPSLEGESSISLGEPDTLAIQRAESSQRDVCEKDETSSRELESLRRLLVEHQEGMGVVTQKYAELQAEHEETLGLVEQLKAEVQRTKVVSPTTPTTPKSQVIRRMTSQNLINPDRAHRSFATLRNIAAEEFESRPDTMQNFELNLNTAMHELHSRMERIQALEAENKNVKKEMEMKATIISGLTRERSSLQGQSPVDSSVVSQMRDQIVHCETQIKELQEAHDIREKELTSELQTLNEMLTVHKTALEHKEVEVQGHKERIVQLEDENTQWQEKHQSVMSDLESAQEKLQSTIEELQRATTERSQWQDKHQAAADELVASEKQLQTTRAELDAALASVDAMRSERNEVDGANAQQIADAATSLENERLKHQELVDSLKKDIEELKESIAANMSTISDLEKAHTDSRTELADRIAEKETTSKELESYRSRVNELSRQIESHKSASEAQQAELASLQMSHAEELKELEIRTKAAAEAEYESRIAQENVKHQQALDDLQAEITSSKNELTQLLNTINSVLSTPVTVDTIHTQLQDIISQKQHFADKYSELIEANEALLRQVDEKQSGHADLEQQISALNDKSEKQEAKVNELAHLVATHEDSLSAKDELIKKKEALITELKTEKDKSLRLVEELEEQITNTFDQHHNRLSVIQAERNQALEEANAKVALYEKEVESYRARIEQLEAHTRNGSPEGHNADRTSSISSNLRKSASAASLPSPPPAIPLPPLPNIAAAANTGSISPPSSRHTSKELVNAQLVEDQEARIRTIEKHLHAEKQLTATLEEALGDLEAQSNKVKTDMEGWKKKAWQLEEELNTLRSERNSARLSLQAVEEERNARREAEAARAHLEEKMNAISKKKKKSTLNCF